MVRKMRAEIQERYYVLLALIKAAGIAFGRTSQTFRDRLDVLIATVCLAFDVELLKNKLCAILLILCTLPVVFLDGDATATVFMAFIAVPMFFAKEPWIY